MLNIDLHCHSNVSDGVLSPADVVARAAANGVHVLALTDHDDVSGLAAAQAAAAADGSDADSWGRNLGDLGRADGAYRWPAHRSAASLIWLPACTIFVLAASSGPTAWPRIWRSTASRARMKARMATPPTSRWWGARISRAGWWRRAMRPTCAPRSNVFSPSGNPGYVEHEWTSLENAIGWIRASGGMAVVAHPGRYAFNARQLLLLLDAFRALGGEGIEVITGSHHPSEYGKFADLARAFGLKASRGADFHAPGEGIDIGRLPAAAALLPARLARLAGACAAFFPFHCLRLYGAIFQYPCRQSATPADPAGGRYSQARRRDRLSNGLVLCARLPHWRQGSGDAAAVGARTRHRA